MTRRPVTPLTPLALVALAALVLAACGGGGGSSSESSAAASSGSEQGTSTTVEQDASAFPVTIEHMLGKVTIAEPPQRVLALGMADQDIALALDITPVGMIEDPYSDDGVFPWVRGEYDVDDVEKVPLNLEQAPTEKLVALKPDLILATSAAGSEQMYDRYSKLGVPIIAPIEGPVADTWQDRIRVIGKALGRSDAAEALVADTEKVVDDFAAENPGLEGRTFTVGNAVSSSQVRAVNQSSDSAAQFFEDLGMEIAPGLTTVDNDTVVGAVDISNERFDLLDADAIFLAGDDKSIEAVESSSLFAGLDAVEDGRYQHYDGEVGYGLRAPTPLSIPYVLAQLRPTLEKTAALGS